MATIIKRESQHLASGNELRGAALDFTDMASQADSYLADVRVEAAKIVKQAQQEADEIRQQAEAAGQQAAEAAIERILDSKVAQRMKSLTPALATAVRQIEDSLQDWLQHWETAATQFACEIAARIIRRELETHPEIALQWVQEALRMCAGSAEITVRLNPNEMETLGDQVRQLTEVFHPVAPAKIVADNSLSVGGCRVETEFGSVDQQIETQLKRLQEELS